MACSASTYHTITASAGLNGSISPVGEVQVIDGDCQTFTFTPANGYRVATVIVDGDPITPAPSSYTFINVNGDRTIHVTFEEISTLTYIISGTIGLNGSIAPALPHTVNAGESVTFTVTPDIGYIIATLTVDGIPVIPPQGSVTFPNVNEDHTIEVTFEEDPSPPPTYTISGTVGPNGSISPTLPHIIVAGNSITFSITPDPGYIIATLTVDGTPVIPPQESVIFTDVNDNHTIEVTFELEPSTKYTIVAYGEDGGIAVPTGIWELDEGTEIVISFDSERGHDLAEVWVNDTLDLKARDDKYIQLTVDQDYEIVAVGELREQILVDFFIVDSDTTVTVLDEIMFIPMSIGILDPVTWIWDFGDGKRETKNNAEAIKHIYTMPGIYTVSLIGINGHLSGTETKIGYIIVEPKLK